MNAGAFGSLRFRLILPAALGVGLAILIAALVLIVAYRAALTRSFDQRLEVFLDFLIANLELEDGALLLSQELADTRFTRAYSGWYWQVSFADPEAAGAVGGVLRSRSLFDTVLVPPAVATLIGGTQVGTGLGPMGKTLRIARRDILLEGARATFLVAADQGEIDAAIRDFVFALMISLLALALGLGAALAVQVNYALAPLRRLRLALGEVRSGKTQRLEGAFVHEVEPLVSELNQLLAHNAEVLSRARTQVGNLAHALKTPLSVLRNEAEAAGESEALKEAVRRETATMGRQVDLYLARARAAASANVLGARTPVSARLAAVIRAMEKIYRARDLRYEAICPDALAFRGEAQDLDEILGNLLDNASKWARTRVRVTVGAELGRLSLVVEDDGPGLPEAARTNVISRGERLDENVPGSGLGLSIVRDLTELYGGSLDLAASVLGGLAAKAMLPAAG